MGRRLRRQNGSGPFIDSVGLPFSLAFKRLEETV